MSLDFGKALNKTDLANRGQFSSLCQNPTTPVSLEKLIKRKEIGGGGSGADGGAAEEMDQDGSDVGGSSRGASGAHGGAATPEDWDGQQEIDNGSGEDNGGAAEEMDQDGSGVGGLSGRVHPAGWEMKTRGQKKMYWKRRRPSGKGLPPP